MGTQYIDPINGDNTNDGSSEVLAVRSFEQAALNLGFGISSTSYTKHYYGSDTDVFNFVRGISLVTKNIAITTDLTSSGSPTYSLILQGLNGAIMKHLSGSILFNFASSNITSGSSTYYFRGSLLIKHLNLINNPSIDGVINGTMCSAQVLNSSIKGCSFTAGAPTSITSVVYDATSPTTITIPSNYSTNVYDTTPSGYIKTAPAQTALGNGAFLPAPSNDLNWMPRGAIDFITQGWLDDAAYGDGRPSINHSYITIDTGTSCRVLGPVLEYPEGIDFTSHFIDSIEDDTLGTDHNEVLDSTPSDATRTIEARASTSSFLQEDTSPTWVTLEKNATNSSVIGKFVQFRITLTSIGK